MNKAKSKKRILVLIMSAAMTFSFAMAPVSFADNLTTKKDELSDINDDIAALEKALASGKSEASSLSKQIKSIENKVYDAQKKINSLTANVNTTKEQISEALAELESIQSDIDEHDANLNLRIRTMYKSGEISILSVLLGSDSMSDFLTNVEMAKRIYQQDEALLESMQADYDAVFEKKEQLAQLKERLTNQQNELVSYKGELSKSEDALARQKKSVESNNKTLEAQIDSLNAEADRLVAEILKLQGNEAYTGGTMCWPSKASTRITSPFGYRKHPILKVNKLHTGIDIGAPMGSDILAANSGKVITAAYNAGGYGYYIMIDHGGGIVTLYAHSSKLLVKKGDVVTRGQVIAKVGSTGMSTGAHLHFEVRINGNYVDPLGYVTAGKY